MHICLDWKVKVNIDFIESCLGLEKCVVTILNLSALIENCL